MNKPFHKWNKVKEQTQLEELRLYTVREIWWCKIGINIGFEQDGNGQHFQRPVVILSSFGPCICLVVPLTTSKKKHHLRLPLGEVAGKEATGLVSQLRVIDTRRLTEKIGFLETEQFRKLRKTVRNII